MKKVIIEWQNQFGGWHGSKNNTTNQVLIELPSNVRNVKARGTA